MIAPGMPSSWQHSGVHGGSAFAHLHQLQPSLRSRTTYSSSLQHLSMLHAKPTSPSYGLVHLPRRQMAPVLPQCAASSAWVMASIPAGSMLIGGILPLLLSRTLPKRFVHAMQHFSAGMLLAAVATEMVPALVAAEAIREICAVLIGFSLGVAVMIGLAAVTSSDGEASEPKPAAEGPVLTAQTQSSRRDKWAKLEPPPWRNPTWRTPTWRTPNRKPDPPAWRNPKRKSGPLQLVGEKVRRFIMRMVGGDAGRWWSVDRLQSANTSSLPLTLALAVYIDAAVDGLLIGLALASQTGTGLFLAIALSVEMFFLGMTFSTSCQYLRTKVRLLAISLGPAILITGSFLGGKLAQALAVNNAALVGGIAFASAALLYMICEELLLDAHEDGQEHVWWVDLQVYLGFMLSLVLEKVV